MRIGLDVGSTTIKCVVLNDNQQIVYQSYERHFSQITQKMTELLEKINALGVGPQGFGGDTTALAVNIEWAPTHIAGLPVSVNVGCHVTRHKIVTI